MIKYSISTEIANNLFFDFGLTSKLWIELKQIEIYCKEKVIYIADKSSRSNDEYCLLAYNFTMGY